MRNPFMMTSNRADLCTVFTSMKVEYVACTVFTTRSLGWRPWFAWSTGKCDDGHGGRSAKARHLPARRPTPGARGGGQGAGAGGRSRGGGVARGHPAGGGGTERGVPALRRPAGAAPPRPFRPPGGGCGGGRGGEGAG